MDSTIHICRTSSISSPTTSTKTNILATSRLRNSILQGSMIPLLAKLMELVVVKTFPTKAVACWMELQLPPARTSRIHSLRPRYQAIDRQEATVISLANTSQVQGRWVTPTHTLCHSRCPIIHQPPESSVPNTRTKMAIRETSNTLTRRHQIATVMMRMMKIRILPTSKTTARTMIALKAHSLTMNQARGR